MSCKAIVVAFVCAVVCAQPLQAETMNVNNGKFRGDNMKIIGHNNDLGGNFLEIIGNNNKVEGSNLVISGNNIHAIGDDITLNGHNAVISGQSTAFVKGDNAKVDMHDVTIDGNNADVDGNEATIKGDNARVDGDSAKITGNNAEVDGNSASTTGTNANIDGDDAHVCSEIGNKVTVTGDNVEVMVVYKPRGVAAPRRHSMIYDNVIVIKGHGATITSDQANCPDLQLNEDYDYDVKIWGENVEVTVDNVVVTGNVQKLGNNISINDTGNNDLQTEE